MAYLNEEPVYPAGVYRLEKNDPVEGGPPEFDGDGNPTAGWDNAPNLQLANRTAFLKAAVDALGSVDALSGAAYTGDMNALKTAGWHEVASGASNKPAGGKFICLVAMGAAETEGAQHAFRLTDNTVYYRALSGGTWGTWRRLAATDELGTAAALDAGTGENQLPQNKDLGSAAYLDAANVGMPPGAVVPFAIQYWQLPDGWLYCDGSAISRTTYAALFDAIGVQFGSGDGSTTFNIPDARDYFIRDSYSHNLGATREDQLRYHKHVVPWGEKYDRPADYPWGRSPNKGKSGSGDTDDDNAWYYTNDGRDFEGAPINRTLGTNRAFMGNETHPRFLTLFYAIKY